MFNVTINYFDKFNVTFSSWESDIIFKKCKDMATVQYFLWKQLEKIRKQNGQIQNITIVKI